MGRSSVEQDTVAQRDGIFAEQSQTENKLTLLDLIEHPRTVAQAKDKAKDQPKDQPSNPQPATFHDQYDELKGAIESGGIRSNPDRLIALSKALLERSDEQFVQTWHELKPKFEKIAPAIEVVASKRAALLADGKAIADGLPENEKKAAVKALEVMKDMQEFNPKYRGHAIEQVRKNPSLVGIADGLSKIEDEYVVALAELDKLVPPMRGALLDMHFTQSLARKVFLHTDTIDNEKDFEDRKRLVSGSMGIPVSELLKAPEPFLQDRYKAGSAPVKFWKEKK